MVVVPREARMNDLTSKYENIIKERIINGEYRIGEKIPPLRDLAAELNCSRSVINVVIARLAAQGYLVIQKRQKTVVSDFLNAGSLNIIKDIIFSNNKDLQYLTSKSMLAARKLIEVESVRQACRKCDEKEIVTLERIINAELKLLADGVTNFEVIAENDFSFHNQLIQMSGNVLYRIIMNSIKDVALYMTKYFYESKSIFFEKYVACHQKILLAVRNQDEEQAAKILTEILEHGEKLYIDLF
jgi:GntR family transcriptional repressor for pyruvate dehydrogenase complex